MVYSGTYAEAENNGWLAGWIARQQCTGASDRGDDDVLVSTPRPREHPETGRHPYSFIAKETAWRQSPRLAEAAAPGLLAARWQSTSAGVQEANTETAADGYVVGLVMRPMNIRLSVAGRLVHDGAASPGMLHVSEPATAAHCLFRGQYDALHFFVSRDLLREYGGNVGVLRATPNLMRDPIIQQLGQTLLKAEAFGTTFASLYIDGLNIAIVTRLLALQAAAPAMPGQQRIAKLAHWRLKRASDYIDAHLGEPVSLADIATAAGLSRMHFAAQFKAATGYRPHDYLLHRRIVQAQHLLLTSPVPVVDVALQVGFETQAHFTTVFKRLVGLPPHAWRQSHALGNPCGRILPVHVPRRTVAGPATGASQHAPYATGRRQPEPAHAPCERR